MKRLACFGIWLAMGAGAAFAHPDGAPWGAADPAGAQSCNACHFDYEPVRESARVMLDGLPAMVRPGESYVLVLRLAPGETAVAGFLISASAGAFHHAGKGVEANEQEIRSIAPSPATDGAQWRFRWTAPQDVSGKIVFHAAINSANDDASPFGDIIHFKTFTAEIGE